MALPGNSGNFRDCVSRVMIFRRRDSRRITEPGCIGRLQGWALIAKLLVFRETNYYGDAPLVGMHLSKRAGIVDARCNMSSIMQKLCASPGLLRVVTFRGEVYFLLPS